MFKIWRLTTMITLLQIIFAVTITPLSTSFIELEESLGVATYTGAGLALLLFVIRLTIRRQDYMKEARLGTALSFTSAFASTTLMNYLRYIPESNPIFMYTACFSGMMLGFYFILTIKFAKDVAPSSNIAAIAMCCMPLGIGVILGGIILALSKLKRSK